MATLEDVRKYAPLAVIVTGIISSSAVAFFRLDQMDERISKFESQSEKINDLSVKQAVIFERSDQILKSLDRLHERMDKNKSPSSPIAQ